MPAFYPEITTKSQLLANTLLRVPGRGDKAVNVADADDMPMRPALYYSEENETPRGVASKLGVPIMELVNLNKSR